MPPEAAPFMPNRSSMWARHSSDLHPSSFPVAGRNFAPGPGPLVHPLREERRSPQAARDPPEPPDGPEVGRDPRDASSTTARDSCAARGVQSPHLEHQHHGGRRTGRAPSAAWALAPGTPCSLGLRERGSVAHASPRNARPASRAAPTMAPESLRSSTRTQPPAARVHGCARTVVVGCRQAAKPAPRCDIPLPELSTTGEEISGRFIVLIKRRGTQL